MSVQACVKSELELFEPPLIQMSMTRSVFVDIYPLTSLDGSGPIEFHLMGTQDEYLDLNDSMLYIKMKVLKSDGTDLAVNADAVPANLTLDALFSDVSLTLNDTLIEGGHHLYPFKSILTSVLQFNGEVKKTQLAYAGFGTDTERKDMIKQSRWFELSGPLNLDMFQQSRYILPGVNLRVKFSRSKLDFVFTNAGTKGQLKTVFEKVFLHVRKVKVNPAVLEGHEYGLKTQNAIYPIQQSEMTTFTIPTGSSYHMQDNLFHGQVPKLVIIGMLTNSSFNGDAAESPMQFKHFSLTQLSLQRDGENVPYTQPLQVDFDNKLNAQAYMRMIQNLEMFNSNISNGITPSEYLKSYPLFVFNLTPDLSASGMCGQPYQTAGMRLDMKFGVALAQSINVIVMAIYDGRIEITKNRQVLKLQ